LYGIIFNIAKRVVVYWLMKIGTIKKDSEKAGSLSLTTLSKIATNYIISGI